MATTINPSDQTITQYNVQTGGASNLLNNVAPSATSGVPVISQGAAAQPVFGTAVVAGGGTGDTSFTAYSVITGGTTPTGALQNVSGVGSPGQVLTSNGASALPTWQGAGNPPTANSIVAIVDDFIGVSLPTSTRLVSNIGWLVTSNKFGIVGAANTSAHPGIIYTFGATATVASIISDANASSQIVLGGGVVSCNWVFNVSALSTVTNRYVFNIGLGDTTTTSDQANGCYFRYSDNVNSGNWQIVCAASSVLTTISTSTAFTTGWHNVGVTVNAAASSVEFFLDAVSLGTVVTHIPTLQISPTVKVNVTAGSLVDQGLAIDLVYLNIALTTPR